MTQENALVLSEEMRVIWSKAGSTFPGDKLHEVLARTLVDLPKDRTFLDYYEIRRIDVPTAFDALLKLQNTGVAHRYIETDESEFREVLRVETTLLNAIMLSLALLLDVILGVLSPVSSGGGKPPVTAIPLVTSVPGSKPYTPTWKRKPQSIGYDGPSL
nr:hypothetical protein [uncultured Pseudomonas sp.]